MHPQPGSSVTRATLSVPTLRGEIQLSFARTRSTDSVTHESSSSTVADGGGSEFGDGVGSVLSLNLTVPGNTLAEVCLPVGLLSDRSPDGYVKITLNGTEVVGRVPDGRIGQLCLPQDLQGGVHTIVAQ